MGLSIPEVQRDMVTLKRSPVGLWGGGHKGFLASVVVWRIRSFFSAQKNYDSHTGEITKPVKHTTTSNTNPSQATHAASPNPTNRQSLSTWCTLGASPSAPPAARRSRREAAIARAAAQANRLHHLRRQACSARRLRTTVKHIASSDQRPPTAPATTTNFARRPGCTNSGYVRSLRRRASTKATPSLAAFPRRAEASQWSADTRVVSTANWPTPCNGRPSTTVSNRRPSLGGTGRSKSRTNKLVATCPPASWEMRAATLSIANLRLPRTPACAHDAR